MSIKALLAKKPDIQATLSTEASTPDNEDPSIATTPHPSMLTNSKKIQESVTLDLTSTEDDQPAPKVASIQVTMGLAEKLAKLKQEKAAAAAATQAQASETAAPLTSGLAEKLAQLKAAKALASATAEKQAEVSAEPTQSSVVLEGGMAAKLAQLKAAKLEAAAAAAPAASPAVEESAPVAAAATPVAEPKPKRTYKKRASPAATEVSSTPATTATPEASETPEVSKPKRSYKKRPSPAKVEEEKAAAAAAAAATEEVSPIKQALLGLPVKKIKAVSGHVQVRIMAENRTVKVPLLGRLMTVSELRQAVFEASGGTLEPSAQRLAYGGKMMEDLRADGKEATLFQYSVKPDTTIQCFPQKSESSAAMDVVDEPAMEEKAAEPAEATTTTTAAPDAPVSLISDAVVVDGVVLCVGRSEHDEANVHLAADEDDEGAVVRRWAKSWRLSEPVFPKAPEANAASSSSNTMEEVTEQQAQQEPEEVPLESALTCAPEQLIGRRVMITDAEGDVFCGDVVSILPESGLFKVQLFVASDSVRETELTLDEVREAVETNQAAEDEANKKKASKKRAASSKREAPQQSFVTIEFEHELACGFPRSLPKGSVYRVMYRPLVAETPAVKPKVEDADAKADSESPSKRPSRASAQKAAKAVKAYTEDDDQQQDADSEFSGAESEGDDDADSEADDALEDEGVWEQVQGQRTGKSMGGNKLSFTISVPGALPEGYYTLGLVEPLDEGSCWSCRGDSNKLECETCGCQACKQKTTPEKMIECDQTGSYYHTFCLDESLGKHVAVDAETGETVLSKEGNLTDEEFALLTSKDSIKWFCPEVATSQDTIEAGRLGKVVKQSRTKNKANGAAAAPAERKLRPCDLTDRNWGGGMSCVGRTKQCTVVPANHFGAVPGVPVGTMWEFRMKTSESGIHRPPVGGMHGKEKEGCYSIVLAGGYSDDEDEGDEFMYTGSGGRDLSGNKRCAPQSKDQELTGTNAALARNCVPEDWKSGKPVRVVRASKLVKTKHGKYAPKVPQGWQQSYRYDGLYKVKHFGLVPGAAGFKVWRYCLVRDDPEPAPWTEKGAANHKKFGYPPLIEADLALAQWTAASKNRLKAPAEEEEKAEPAKKRAKKSPGAAMTAEQKRTNKVIDELAAAGSKVWAELVASADSTQAYSEQTAFLEAVSEAFRCPITQELAYPPVTLPSGHTMSLSGFDMHVKKCREVGKAPHCVMTREEIPAEFANKPVIDEALRKTLMMLMPAVCKAMEAE